MIRRFPVAPAPRAAAPRAAAITTLLALSAVRAAAQAPSYDEAMLDRVRFRHIGPAGMSGRVTDLAVYEADPTTYYVATATGGVWKTVNDGSTIVPVFERQAVHSVGAVAVFQGDPDVVWVGTGEATNRQSSGWGDGVYRSTDGGRTWRNTGLREGRHVARIVTHPTNRDVAYVAVPGNLWGPSPDRGLYKTVDGGATWQRVLAGNEDTGVTEVVMDPSDPDILYAATYQRRRQAFGFVGGGPGSALWRTTDGGATWAKLGNGLPTGVVGRIGISVYRRNPQVVYVSVEQGRRYTSSISYEERLGGIYRSDDRGQSWRFMGDWNPRPAYSSKLLVDPSDEARLYQVQYSVSDDSGRTWREPRQSLHGDDRIIWVNPRDSRHLIKGDDGGVGVSHDRGATWTFQRALPVAQFYHVGVDNSVPFRVCGGLQDNGSWCGPSRTTWADGILTEDWFRVGGGDGFHTVFDTTDNRTLYVTSQYLGLTRVDLRTMETRRIRPMWPDGDAGKRGNWGAPPPRVGRFDQGANWNAPVVLSAFDPKTLYVGMRALYRSRDRGETWQRLVDPTTGVNRRSLPIMGQLPDSATLSLDDGVSFFPTVSAIAESPRDAKVLWVGTDDGQLQLSRDGGGAWTSVRDAVPDVPRGTWVRHLEASRWQTGTAYVIFDGHQSGDFRSWMFRTRDYGQTWREVGADLPTQIGPHVLREDPVDPNLLWLGTEFGLYLSTDGGTSWVRFRANLPTVPVFDLVVHPRDHALVLATHGRGIWILDDVRPFRNVRPGRGPTLAPGATVARQERRPSRLAHVGDMHFAGENPPAGAVFSIWSPDSSTSAVLSIRADLKGEVYYQALALPRGLSQVVWSLRGPALPAGGVGDDESGPPRPIPGAFVPPGPYVATLTSGGQVVGLRPLTVLPDPRQDVPAPVRAAWHAALDSVEKVHRAVDALEQRTRAAAGLPGPMRERADTLAELRQRTGTLFRMLEAQVGLPTADMRAQLDAYQRLYARLERAPMP